MASFALFGSSTGVRTLNNGESGFIAQNGVLGTDTTAITAALGSVDITVLGSVNSATGRAISFSGTTLDLQIGQNGSIGAQKDDTIKANFSSSVYVSNAGYLYSGSDAIDLRESDGAGSIIIDNTGTISGKSDAIVTDSGTETTRITNTGEIVGGSGGIDHISGDATIINYGSIIGKFYAYDGASGIDTVKNFGTIDGGVKVRDGDDIVTNRGTLDFVELGDGTDVFDGRGGIVTEYVAGGLGDDTYIVSASDISLVELADEGIDLVKSNVSFTLGDNIENLTLIGNSNIRGTGNALNNVVFGNDEDNILRGLTGADTLNGGGGNDILRGGRAGDKLIGDFGDDTLRGGVGNDDLAGGAGDDILIGGAGKDKLNGGTGSDMFVFNRAPHSPNSSARDVIQDFELGIDRIDLSDLVAGTLSFVGTSGFSGTGAEVNAVITGGNTTVRIDVDGDGAADMKIILAGVTGIQDGDFIL
ncbi:MAG: hypothetical protein COC12_06730 [Rhodobacteraceae bacterium]|nr:MAG: hypothetical protein COC12_06730 [Paracoccaceae bacterium]